jgi:hypothetical protein
MKPWRLHWIAQELSREVWINPPAFRGSACQLFAILHKGLEKATRQTAVKRFNKKQKLEQ